MIRQILSPTVDSAAPAKTASYGMNEEQRSPSGRRCLREHPNPQSLKPPVTRILVRVRLLDHGKSWGTKPRRVRGPAQEQPDAGDCQENSEDQRRIEPDIACYTCAQGGHDKFDA